MSITSWGEGPLNGSTLTSAGTRLWSALRNRKHGAHPGAETTAARGSVTRMPRRSACARGGCRRPDRGTIRAHFKPRLGGDSRSSNRTAAKSRPPSLQSVADLNAGADPTVAVPRRLPARPITLRNDVDGGRRRRDIDRGRSWSGEGRADDGARGEAAEQPRGDITASGMRVACHRKRGHANGS